MITDTDEYIKLRTEFLAKLKLTFEYQRKRKCDMSMSSWNFVFYTSLKSKNTETPLYPIGIVSSNLYIPNRKDVDKEFEWLIQQFDYLKNYNIYPCYEYGRLI